MSAGDPDQPSASAPADADRLLGDAAAAAEGARARLDAAMVDLFLPLAVRLSDADRAAAAHLLALLVAATEAELRRTLAGHPDIAEALATISAAPVLGSAGVLRDAALAAAVLRRVTGQRLARGLAAAAARDAGAGAEDAPLDRMLDDPDDALARDALALLVAEGRQRETFGLAFARTDLPAEVQHRLVWHVAAALRAQLAPRCGTARTDAALAQAGTAALAGYDEAQTLEARAVALARRLDRAARLDDALIVRAVAEGRLPLAVAGIAARAALGFGAVWDMLSDPEGSQLVVLLRAIDMPRAAAADIALRLALAADPADDGERVAERMDAYDALPVARAQDALRLWRLDPAYREAIGAVRAGLAPRGAVP